MSNVCSSNWQRIAGIQLAVLAYAEVLSFRIQDCSVRRFRFYHVVNARFQPSVLGAVACFDIVQLGVVAAIHIQADILGDHCTVLCIDVYHCAGQRVFVLVNLFQLYLYAGLSVDNECALCALIRAVSCRRRCQNGIDGHVVGIDAHTIRRQGRIIKALGCGDGSSVQLPGIAVLF